ncbi:MAG: hypothetical protein IPM48_12785 [Saprospiraceae bacterium]|nr:hypothetical protein [Saprospiraceae bacterium]
MIPEAVPAEFLDKAKALGSKCPSCGGSIGFDPKTTQLLCEYCGYNESLPNKNDQIKELKYSRNEGEEELFYLDPESKKAYHCNSCGATVLVDADQIKSNCSFCASEVTLIDAFQQRIIKPAGIIPFYLGKKEAENKFSDWIKQGWFHPSKLKDAASLDALVGIYTPFWTFDFQVYAEWCGEAGYYYTEYHNAYVNGKWVTKPVTKVRWVYRSGTLNHFFDDILIAASDMIDPKFRSKIAGYRLNEMVNFDTRFMMGWQSELYNQNIQSCYELAERQVMEQVRHMCSGQLGGNTQRNLHVTTQLSQQTYKHVYLPLWISAYKYQGKVYKILINGQTGKVYGDKPWSWIKIGLLIFLFLALVFTIWWMREYGLMD